jgi:hypothetical protein
MKLFRTLYKSFLFLTLAALGYVTFLFVTPVTASNLQTRVTSLCTVGNIATQIDRKYRLTGLSQKDADCGCLSRKLLQSRSKTEAARLTDTTRQLFVNAMRAKITRSMPSFEGIDRNDLQTIQRFFENAGAVCAVSA